jgi:hypothetical protein
MLTMKLMGDINTGDTKKFVRLYNHKLHLQEVATNQIMCQYTVLREWKRQNAGVTGHVVRREENL